MVTLDNILLVITEPLEPMKYAEASTTIESGNVKEASIV